jgi:hypothetical protein
LKIAALIGEGFGHYFNDFIAWRSIKRSGGAYEAEVRLWTVWVSMPFFISGLVWFGFSLKEELSWVCLCVSWGFYQFGLVTTTVAITGQLPMISAGINRADFSEPTASTFSPIIVWRWLPSSTCFEHVADSSSTTSRSSGPHQSGRRSLLGLRQE